MFVVPGTLSASSGFFSICCETKTTRRLVLSGGESSRLWLFQALLGATLVFPASSSRHQFEDFISLTAASLLESSSRALSTARDVTDWSSVAVSLLCSATIPVPVKGCLTRHWFCGSSSELRFGREAVSSAVWCCVQVSFGGISKALLLRKRHEKSRHPRQGEPHIFVIIVNG
ncbi:hypothetical protein F2Q69_00060559 [Brassica cretica]|uniref:Uncharacterized protein n=1 Tax=Brassica cretica TaxID=69181 RepID=A0A8S9RAS9_BRACR|nr:hypothetical protein F2Q69_00060559 [Brassica cretica]